MRRPIRASVPRPSRSVARLVSVGGVHRPPNPTLQPTSRKLWKQRLRRCILWIRSQLSFALGSEHARHMDNREIRAAADRAEWQIILGVTAAFGLAAWRLFAASILALGDPPNYLLAGGELSVEAGLCAFLALRLRTGRSPPSPP